jgi:hypothetical protein
MAKGVQVVVNEPTLKENDFFNSRAMKDLDVFTAVVMGSLPIVLTPRRKT